ncbi:MAG: hypothetical protein HYU67_09345 [Flavobacteriia bacterium]|nr:hypothetical protein [Flavobacteriia bacterium]
MNSKIAEQISSIHLKIKQIKLKNEELESQRLKNIEEINSLKTEVETLQNKLIECNSFRDELQNEVQNLQEKIQQANTSDNKEKKEEDIYQLVREIEYCIEKLKK